jgi:hypothetical protein
MLLVEPVDGKKMMGEKEGCNGRYHLMLPSASG